MTAVDWIGPGAALLLAAMLPVRYQVRRWLDHHAWQRAEVDAAVSRHPSAAGRPR